MSRSFGYGPAGDKQEMIALIRSAVEQGVTFFDTSRNVCSLHRSTINYHYYNPCLQQVLPLVVDECPRLNRYATGEGTSNFSCPIGLTIRMSSVRPGNLFCCQDSGAPQMGHSRRRGEWRNPLTPDNNCFDRVAVKIICN
jgi:hypothetical protein